MKDGFKEHVASKLKILRVKFDYKQKNVANEAKIDVMTLARYENNSSSMQLDMIEKISTVYGLNLNIF
jgi:transcriptional regulator with XRE-family HTH domain